LWITSLAAAGRRRVGVAVAVQKLQEGVRHLGEHRLVLQERGRQAVHLDGIGRHVALGIDVAVEDPAGRDVVEQLDGADLDHPVTVGRFQPGGLGIDHDLAHRASSGFRYGRPRC
jgi:hypothetical protein